MVQYKIQIDPEALADIQDITDWYNDKQDGLGIKFQETAIKQIDSLKKNPKIYSIRYNEIRCIIVKKFPYMIHFYINDEKAIVEILAVISTDRNPKIWKDKTNKPD